MGTRLLLLPMRPPSLPLWWGIWVAPAETVAGDLLAGVEASRGATVRG
jgi:hypothetical protein